MALETGRCPAFDNPAQVVAEAQQQYPLTWNAADFAPGGKYANAAELTDQYFVHASNWSVSGAGAKVPEGLHYCLGKASFSDAGLIGTNVTVVSEDTIEVAGAGINFTPWQGTPGITFFSTTVSSANVVSVSGAGNTGGTSYGPYGKVSITGAGGMIIGAFMGNTVAVGGAGATINLAQIGLGEGAGGSTVACGHYDLQASADDTTTTMRVWQCEDGESRIVSYQVD